MLAAGHSGAGYHRGVPYFLKIEGIAGESTDAKHKGEIEVESFSWGVSQLASPTPGGGGGAGKPSFDHLHVVTPFSAASPRLFEACVTGRHLRSAVLTGNRGGGGEGGAEGDPAANQKL
jgi:type VI secretion system secreted protein Hcp